MPNSATTRIQLRDELIDWLDTERLRYLAAAVEMGIPTSVTVMRPVVTELSETGMNLKTELQEVSPISIDNVRMQFLRLWSDQKRHPSVARSLFRYYGRRCYCYTPVLTVDFDHDPVKWVSELFLPHFEIEYLSSLRSLEQPDLEGAAVLAEEVLGAIEADELTLVTFVPLGGIRVSEPMSAGSMTVRPLARSELAELSDDSFQRMAMPRRSVALRQLAWGVHTPLRERAALEIREFRPKTTPALPGSLPLRCITALHLLEYPLTGRGLGSCWLEPGHMQTGSGFATSLRRWADTKEMTQADLDQAWSLVSAIKDGALTDSRNRVHIALQRYLLAAAEDRPGEALIDCAICLEALLLPSKEGEYRFKFSLFGSWLLCPDDPDQRTEAFNQLRNVYDMRSQLVHGSTPDAERLADVAQTARRLAARCLISSVLNGWTKPERLQRRAIRSSQSAELRHLPDELAMLSSDLEEEADKP